MESNGVFGFTASRWRLRQAEKYLCSAQGEGKKLSCAQNSLAPSRKATEQLFFFFLEELL
jgi:hypothetical protein